MKKIVFLISAVLLLSFAAAAQDLATPNFSGTWIFDAKSSRADNDFKKEFKDYTLVIVHTEPEIRITRSAVLKNENVSADLILYTDKRGEKNYPYFRVKTQEVVSKTFWKKGTLISESTQKFSRNIDWRINTTEKYILSEDKKTLTITGAISNNIGSAATSLDNGYKWVFRRKE
jgi:hypothetical protein